MHSEEVSRLILADAHLEVGGGGEPCRARANDDRSLSLHLFLLGLLGRFGGRLPLRGVLGWRASVLQIGRDLRGVHGGI